MGRTQRSRFSGTDSEVFSGGRFTALVGLAGYIPGGEVGDVPQNEARGF
jgi:hypothetical protein